MRKDLEYLKDSKDLRDLEESIDSKDLCIKKRILTGERPTGKLHIGHYAGSIMNRVKLQHEYDTFIIIADNKLLQHILKLRKSYQGVYLM